MDAVRYDMMFGTNFRTITAARSYWREQAKQALATGTTTNSEYPQTQQSILLFTYMKELLQSLPSTLTRAGGTTIPGIVGGSTAHTRIGELMDILLEVLDAADLDAVNTYLAGFKPYNLPIPAGGTNNSKDAGFRRARDLIEANRDFIKAEIFAWMDQQRRENRDGFVAPFDGGFNRTECAEDLDLILDAIFYDLTYGGNMETYVAGLAYYAGTSTPSLVNPEEREATIRTYNQLGVLLADIARSTPVKSLQVAIEQVKGTAGSIETAEKLAGLMDIVINVVKGGVKQVPVRQDPNFLAGDETLAYVRIAVQEQKKDLQARIADYIDSFILQYNTEKCARDVGLILDAAMYDLVLNSNFQSITAGSVYLQKAAQVVTNTQIGPQLQAIKFIRDRVIDISQTPPLVKNEAAIGRITNLFDTMFDIIDKGVDVAPEIVNVPPLGAAYNPNAVNAANSILANKEFLKEEVVAYITANYKTYDQSRCSRDVGLIIDAALYDLLLDTNYNSVKAGLAYRRATSSLVVTDQLQETLGGIDFAKQKVVELLDDANAIASVTRSFELISSIIGGGSIPTSRVPLPGASVFALPRPAGSIVRDAAFKAASDAVISAKATLKTAVTNWISSQVSGATAGSIWDGFTYDSAKCQEDVGFILDAVAYDLVYGGNMESLNAGYAYYEGTAEVDSLNDNEVQPTIAAYAYLAEQVKATIEAAAAANEQAAIEGQNLVLLVRNLIDSRANSVAQVSLPDQLWVDPLLQEISVTINNDKARLQDVIIDYVNNIATYTNSAVTTPVNYDQDKCRRDVGLVLDAIRYDLMFNTSFRTISAGRSYRRSFANVITGAAQNQANINSFIELKERVLGKKLTNVVITDTAGNFTCDNSSTVDVTPLYVNQPVRVSGAVAPANNPITGYTNIATQPKTYYIISTNGTTQFELSASVGGTAITTVAGATTGLTFEIRPSIGPLDEVITQGLLDVETLNANVSGEALVLGREYKITSQGTQTVAAGNFVVGGLYEIVDPVGTPWSSIGWNLGGQPAAGDLFTATDVGSGTGTAKFITDYTLYGARDNDVGTVFVATGTPTTAVNGSSVFIGGSGQVQTISFRQAAERLFDLFIAILEDNAAEIEALGFDNDATYNAPAKQGGSGTYYLLTPPPSGTANASVAAILAARNAINTNRTSLENDLITWINAQVTATNGNFAAPFSYTEATCRKDIKLILDAIAYDLTFGGNQETIIAGKAYYDGTALGSDEVLATIDAYNRLKVQITAVTSSGAGRDRALQLIDDLISYIDPKIEDPAVIEADTSWVDSELYVFSDKLKAEAETVAKSTTDYINANFPALVGNYNVDKCRRDVRLIIDAVRWDMMFNTTFRTIVAARSYYRSQVVDGNFTSGSAGSQKPATIAAFGVVKVALDEIVKSDAVAQSRVASLMQLVLDILDDVANVPVITSGTFPYGGTPNATDIGYLNARDRIEENRDFILAEMRDWLVDNVSSPAPTGYDQDTCIRDVELVLDALRFDLTFGGNLESVTAGKAYYAGAVLGSNDTDHKDFTKDAFEHLSLVVKAVATNATTYAGSIVPAQVTANDPGSSLAADQAEALVMTVRSYVDTNSGNALVRPSTSWVDNNLALFASTMLDRKDSLALQVTDYVTAQFPTLTYSVADCQDDVKDIVEAVRYDMMFGTVFRSWTAGKAYYRANASTVLASQKEASLAAMRYLKGLLAAITGTNVTATHRVKSSMNVVIDTLELGPTTRNAYDARISAAVQAIDAGKDAVLAAMSTWLDTADNSYTFANYDKTTCLRDIGYLIDAIKYDLTYGGNMETVVAGRAYYNGAVLESSDPDHIDATQAAFLEVAAELKGLSGVTASVGALIDTLVADVNALIDSSTSRDEVYADASWAETPIQEVGVAMRLQANTIKSQVTSYVTANFPALTFDQVKCARDVGLIIDAVRWDMLFNSNFRSITTGRAYWRDAVNLAADGLASLNQKQASVAAFTYLKDVLQGIAGTNAIAAERITSNMDIILEILENGTNDINNNQANPTITYGTVADAERVKAKDILLANKDFIKAEVIAYINDTYNSFSYDEELCARDVELITTAVAYDMVTGSNYHTVTAARGYLRSYASDVLTQDKQKHITILAFKFLKNLLANYVGGNASAVTKVKASLDVIIGAVYDENANSLPADGPDNLTWPTNTGITVTANQTSARTWLTTGANVTAAVTAGTGGLTGATLTKCERDIKYILEALLHDLYYGGNWATTIAARSYWSKDANGNDQIQLGVGEESATITKFNLVRDYINTNMNVLNTRVTALFAIITDVIDTTKDGLAELPAVEYPELLGADNALEAARNILLSNVANAKAKTIRYVNNRAYFVYDIVKCERDIGLILDAVHTDIVTNSNFLSLQAGRAYLRSSANGALAAAQKWAILTGLTHAKSVLSALVSTNAEMVSRIRARLSNIIDIINDESDSNVSLTLTNSTTTYSSVVARQNSASAIQAEKDTLISSTIADIASNYASLSYDQAACERDLGYIIDAISHDVLYGGNWGVTVAAKAYWEGGALNLGPGDEQAATLGALEFLRISINALGGVTSDAEVTTLINRIKAVLDNADTAGFTGSTDLAEANALAITEPTLTGATQAYIDAKATLVAAKDASTYKILDYMNSRPYLDYTGDTVTSCERDVNAIITALSYDIPSGSNFKSIKAGQAYLRSYSKVVTQEQKQATIGALYFIKKKVSEAVAGSVKTDARVLMNTIIDIVDRGIIATPEITITATGTSAATATAASNTLASNADFIKAEIRAYIDRNYPELDYNKIKCERDVQYILDALRYDLVYGGNSETREAGLAYWEGNKITLGTHPSDIDDVDITGGEDEKIATVASYQYLADLVKIVLNNTSYTPLQTVVSKGTHTANALATTAEGLVDAVVSIINNVPETLAGAIAAVAETLPTAITANATIAGLTSLDTDTSAEILKAFELDNATDVQFFVYNEAKCARDVGFVVEALAFDALYGGNKETRVTALEYAYKGGLVIPMATKAPTVGGFVHLASFIDDIVAGTSVTPTTGNTADQKNASDTPAVPGSSLTGVSDLAQIVVDVIKGGKTAAPALDEPVFADVVGYKPDNVVIRAVVRDSIDSIAAQTITFINETYAGFGYLQDTCKRDVGLTLDAVAYDLIYGGNSRTKFASEQYYSGGRFQIPADSKSATVACFVYLDALVRKVITNDAIVTFQNYVDQDKSNPAATNSEVTNVVALFDAFTDILTNGYISVVQLDATFTRSVNDNTYATFHQVSTITTTGHTLEWVGTGIDVDSALPYNGGVPKPENQLVSDKGGFINFTSTDEKGDFRIGPDLTIKRDSGSIVGRAFNKSLLGVVTPYILALQS
jgi:stalled ribosome rescue protein Dom34